MKLGIVYLAIFLPACVAILVNVILANTDKAPKRRSKRRYAVYISQLVLMIGIIGVIFLGMFVFLAPFIWDDVHFIFYIVFGSGIWAGIYMIIYQMRFCIVVEQEKITVYPLFRRSYSFTFHDVYTVKRQTKNLYKGQTERIVLRTEQGKKVIVESSFVNYFKFTEQIQNCVDASKLSGFDGTRK